MSNSYGHFPRDEWDADDPFGREPSVQKWKHYRRPSRNPGDLVAVMDKIVDQLPTANKGILK